MDFEFTSDLNAIWPASYWKTNKGDGDMLVNPPMVLGLIVNHLSDRMKRGINFDFIIGCKAVGAKPYF